MVVVEKRLTIRADSSKEDIPVLWRVNTMEHLDAAQGKADEVKS